MKINSIILKNWRQYYGHNKIDLSVKSGKNIVLIGGKNGYGKTNFLLSMVWCLFGEKLSLVDENFKKEIQSARNYQTFMHNSLNRNSNQHGNKEFSIQMHFSELDLPNQYNIESEIIIERIFNIEKSQEKLFVKTSNQAIIIEDIIEASEFINNYLIPLEAAKFVFFDAEKISEIANYSLREEGTYLNDALSKILGLQFYEDLTQDISTYAASLKKAGAEKNIHDQIDMTEKGILVKKDKVTTLEKEIADAESQIQEYRYKIKEYDNAILKHGNPGGITKVHQNELSSEIEKLNKELTELTEEYNQISNTFPLLILGGNIIGIQDLIENQNKRDLEKNELKNKSELLNEFIEKLLNQPPFPENSTLSMKDKVFLFDKAQKLMNDFIEQRKENNENLESFQLDLNLSEKKLINTAIEFIQSQSIEYIERLINRISDLKILLVQTQNKLNQLEVVEQDEMIDEFERKKSVIEKKITDLTQSVGRKKESISTALDHIIIGQKNIENQIKRVNLNKEIKRKYELSDKYIKFFNSILKEEKRKKKISLENKILEELKKIMHKLSSQEYSLISRVEVSILPDKEGMKVNLFDEDNIEIKKESLSQGEKQLYISCLIKAILSESMVNYPIFIDTPLARLDDEHIEGILKNYYPNLSEQVIILSTNNEINQRRHSIIENNVNKAFLLNSLGGKTTIEEGYFKRNLI